MLVPGVLRLYVLNIDILGVLPVLLEDEKLRLS